jgi:two-component sensor histidine kinase
VNLKPGRLVAISLNAIVLCAFLLAGFLIINMVNEHSYSEALKEAKEKANIILTRNHATHEYLNSKLKPSVFSLTEGERPEGYFDPRWMSSTFSVREIDRLFKAEGGGFEGYYYKEAAINARFPENEADEIERDFLQRLNSGGDEMESGIREIDGIPYFVVMKKGETMNGGCLMCHDTPESAPAGLVAYYGPERSFGRHEGDVVSALSIRIPMADALMRAEEISSGLKWGLLSTLGLLLVLQVYITHKLQRGKSLLMGEVAERMATEARLRDALDEKDMLMREVNHRAKNSLAVIQSLLSLQSHSIDDKRSQDSLRQARDRIRSMSMIYERLQRTDDIRDIDAAEYLRSLVNMLFDSGRPASGNVSLDVDIDRISIDIDTIIPLGLLVNELFSNAFKHAFPNGRKGRISFVLGCAKGGDCTLSFSDDGVGLPDDMDINTEGALGMRIISSLVKQIDGKIQILRDSGTRVIISFPPRRH